MKKTISTAVSIILILVIVSGCDGRSRPPPFESYAFVGNFDTDALNNLEKILFWEIKLEDLYRHYTEEDLIFLDIEGYQNVWPPYRIKFVQDIGYFPMFVYNDDSASYSYSLKEGCWNPCLAREARYPAEHLCFHLFAFEPGEENEYKSSYTFHFTPNFKEYLRISDEEYFLSERTNIEGLSFREKVSAFFGFKKNFYKKETVTVGENEIIVYKIFEKYKNRENPSPFYFVMDDMLAYVLRNTEPENLFESGEFVYITREYIKE